MAFDKLINAVSDSFSPSGQFVPAALILKPLREKFRQAHQLEQDTFELRKQALQEARVDRFLDQGRQAESAALQAGESGDFGRQGSLAGQAGESAGQAKAADLGWQGRGGLFAQLEAGKAAVAGRERAGGDPKALAARAGELDAARGEVGKTSGQPAAARFATPGQIGAFATNAASSEKSGQVQRRGAAFEQGMRVSENKRQENQAASQFATNAKLQRDLAVQEQRRKARVIRRQTLRAENANAITAEQVDQALANVENADPEFFNDNPALKGYVAVAKALQAAPGDLPPRERTKLVTGLMNAATTGVTRQQTEVVDKTHQRILAEEIRAQENALAMYKTIGDQMDDRWLEWRGRVDMTIDDWRDWAGTSRPEALEDFRRYSAWTTFVKVARFDWVTEVAKSTFTKEIKKELDQVAMDLGGGPAKFRASLQAMTDYRAAKARRTREFESKGIKPTKHEERQIVTESLIEVLPNLGNHQSAGPPTEGAAIGDDLDALPPDEVINRAKAAGMPPDWMP